MVRWNAHLLTSSLFLKETQKSSNLQLRGHPEDDGRSATNGCYCYLLPVKCQNMRKQGGQKLDGSQDN